MRKRVRHALVCTDGNTPDLALAGVFCGLFQGVSSDAVADGGTHDAFGIETLEDLA